MPLIPRPILFVHGNDPESRTKARQHVSKVVRSRERDKRSKSRHVRKIFPSQRMRKTHTVDENDADSPQSSPPAKSPVNKRHNTRMIETTRGQNWMSRQLSAAPSDPFETLPMKVTPMVAELLYHYRVIMPSVEFGVVGNSPLVPSRDLAFRSAMETPCSLHTIIATSAVQRANLREEKYPVLVSQHLGQSLHLLRKGLSQLNAQNWQTFVQPLIELVACDELRGEYGSLKLHVNGLRQLIQQFGGLSGLTGLPRIQLLTCYVLHGAGVPYFKTFQLPRTRSDNQNLLGESPSSGAAVANPADMFSLPQMVDVREHVDQFCTYMSEISMLSMTKGPAMELIRHYFDSSTRLANLLCRLSLESSHLSCFGQNGFHHVATLLLAVQELTDLIHKKDRMALELTLEKMHLIYHPNIRLYKFYLMQGGTAIGFHNAERNWKVVRLMQVYKLLPIDWRRKVGGVLLDFLQGPEARSSIDDKGSGTATETWSPAILMGSVASNLINEFGGLQLSSHESLRGTSAPLAKRRHLEDTYQDEPLYAHVLR